MFETRISEDISFAEVVVHANLNDQSYRLVFAIDMQTDILKTIRITQQNENTWEPVGELRFDYLKELPENADKFFEPAGRSYGPTKQPEGLLWLLHLIDLLKEYQ